MCVYKNGLFKLSSVPFGIGAYGRVAVSSIWVTPNAFLIFNGTTEMISDIRDKNSGVDLHTIRFINKTIAFSTRLKRMYLLHF